ncbi:MAG: helix-turn-helix transcriptional regulator [Bacteroidaceae bacterium]|nr:helix-turn-helix transcriptional regulator [Bacteroidaceae bacterium]
MKPAIAVISPNTLAAVGLSGLIQGMMPMASINIFRNFKEMSEAGNEQQYFHYFITIGVLLENPKFFISHQHKTLLLVEGDSVGNIPAGFRKIDISVPHDELVKNLMRLEQSVHGAHREQPEPVRVAQSTLKQTVLTPRETEVLRLLVLGKTNKEVAAALNVGLTTVITHRKNLTEKLNIKTLSGLTVYAVSRGIVKVEEI